MAIGDIVNYEGEFSFDLVHPSTNEDFGWVWTVRSSESKAAKKAQVRMAGIELAKAQKARKVKQDASYFEGELNKRIDTRIALAMPCVAGWEVNSDLKKKADPDDDFAFSEKSLEFYLNYPWILGQVEDAIEDIANFTRK